jgi:tetratricopeptide (TPR) repeat protein
MRLSKVIIALIIVVLLNQPVKSSCNAFSLQEFAQSKYFTIEMINPGFGENFISISGLYYTNTQSYPVSLSPSGLHLASININYSINLLDISSGTNIELVSSIGYHSSRFDFLEFSPDGSLIASGGEPPDYTIKLWDVSTGELIHRLVGHTDQVKSVCFSPDGQTLVSGGQDNQVFLWNLATGQGEVLIVDETWITSVVISPTGSLIAAAGWSTKIYIWSFQDQFLRTTISNHTHVIHSLDFSPDGTKLVSGSKDKTVKIWDVSNPDNHLFLHSFTDSTSEIWSVAWSPDPKGNMIAAGTGEPLNANLYLWNATNFMLLVNSSTHIGKVKTVIFSSDATILASSSSDDVIKLWNVAKIAEVDSDTDGMGDDWEEEHDFNNSDYWDRFQDADFDDLINSHEFFWGTNPYNSDSDNDRMMDGWEVKYNLNPLNASDASVDSDGDHLSNLYEFQNKLNPLDPTDAVGDRDRDGMPNTYEGRFGFDPSDPTDAYDDADNDTIPNLIEFCWSLNPLDPTDAGKDKDEDGLPNAWEFAMNLNALNASDALEDSDGDNLTNLLEFYFTSSAIQIDTDNDTMDDYYEWKMGLDPVIDDTLLDKDNDSIPNIWEYLYGLNANDSSDAQQDDDLDGVSNLAEFRGKTNPHDFWSFPLLSLSVVHISFILLLFMGLSISLTMFYYRNQKRKELVNRSKAPDYSIAVHLRSIGYSTYNEYLEAEDQARRLLQKGRELFFSGDLLQAIQLYEETLSIFELHSNDDCITESIYLMARVFMEVGILSKSSSFLRRIPSSPHKGIHSMIQALLAENANNWGEAEELWQKALSFSDLHEAYRLRCQGALLEIEFQSLIRNPTDMAKASFLANLIEWETRCEKEEIPWEQFQAYLLHAKFNFSIYQFEEVDFWYQRCLTITQIAGMQHYYNLVLKEQKDFQQHREQIINLLETERPLSPEEQESLFQEYMQKALKRVQEDIIQ